MSRAQNRTMITPGTMAARMIGAPWRFTMGVTMPFTWAMMRAAAQMRHDLYVDMVHGKGPHTEPLRELHRNYVSAFYDR